MSLQLVANHLAQKGRGPDSTLVHMSNREVAGLQALAKQHGGNLTVNPQTGLPEAGFLDSILPTIAGAGLTYFSGGTISPLMAAGIVGGISALDSKDLSKGLMAGLGAYGGAGLTEGLVGAGLGAVGPGLSEKAAADAAAQGLQGEAYNQAVQNQVASGLAEKNLAAEGASQLFRNPGQTLETIGGGSGYKAAGLLGAAAAPIVADEMVQTTTEAPPQDRGKIRPYTYSRQQIPQDYQGQQGNIGSKERRYFNESYTAGNPYSAANGGLVALARGGYAQRSLFKPTTPLPANNMYGASRDAYDYLMGVSPTSGGQPYDPNRPFPPGMQPSIPEQGMQPDPNTPKTGTGKYVFDPVTKQYKFIPDPIKPVDVAAPVFENANKATSLNHQAKTYEERQAELNAPSSYWNGLTQNEYFSMSPEDRAVVDAKAKAEHPFLSGIGDLAKLALIPGGMVFGAIQDAYNKLNPPPPVPPEAAYAGAYYNPFDTKENIGLPTELTPEERTQYNNVLTGQPSIYDKGLMGINTTPKASEPSVWTDASGNAWQTGDNSPLMTGTGAKTFADQEKNRADESKISEGESGSEPAITREMQLDPNLWGSETDSAANEGVAGTSMQNALNSQALSQQPGLAGLSMQQAIDSQNASISASSPTATGGIANLAPAFGTTQSANDGDAGESDAKAMAAETQSLLNRYTVPAETTTVPTVGFFNSMLKQPTQLAANDGFNLGSEPTARTTESTTETAPATNPMSVDPAQAGIAALAQAQAQADAQAAQAQADREQAGREAARQAEAQAQAAQAAAQAQADREQAGREAARQAEAQARAQAAQQASEGGPGYTSGGDRNSGTVSDHTLSDHISQQDRANDRDGGGGDARGGYYHHGQFNYHPYAYGGIAALGNQYNLGSYSDGGRLLKGPGDGVSDDIPATIGHGQPARLADGEFVIPARIVSELGNGSTDAGARELYKMMDRIQAGRRKTVGKDQVAKNSKAVRHLPA